MRIGMAVRKEVKKLANVGPCTIIPQTLQNGCAVGSWLLYKTLRSIGMRPKLIFGEAWGYDHWWIQIGNEYWDVTATQFSYDIPKVHVTKVSEASDYTPEMYSREAIKEFDEWGDQYQPQLDRALKRLVERFDHE